ncbi:MAG: hypothetical protein ACHQET_08340 [Chitinophagales bacterium]
MNEEKINSEDYIALPSLRKIILIILHYFFALIDQIGEVFRKHKLLMLTGLVSGLVLGYSYFSTRQVYYEVSMVAESPIAYKKTIAQIINSLNQLVKTGSHKKLAAELNLTEFQVQNLLSIAALSLGNEPLDKDSSTLFHQPFKIEAGIKDPEISDSFQIAIVQYLNNKSSLKRMTESQTKFYNEKLAFIDRELQKLDSLKTEYNHFLATSKVSATFYNNAFDPSRAYIQSSDLMNDKEKAVAWLSRDNQPILVIDEFKGPAMPQSTSLMKSLFLGTLITVTCCFFLGLLIELYKKTNRYKFKDS